jgi:hypothetical protein
MFVPEKPFQPSLMFVGKTRRTLAFCEEVFLTAVKSFITLGPGRVGQPLREDGGVGCRQID